MYDCMIYQFIEENNNNNKGNNDNGNRERKQVAFKCNKQTKIKL